MLNCIIDPNSGKITMYFNGEMRTIDREHINYTAICKALKEGDELSLPAVLSQNKFSILDGTASIDNDGTIKIDGKIAHTTLAKRITEFVRKGLPVEPLKRFMENCAKNPNPQSIEELYDFLENRGIPITEDGHFLAYKAVRSDMKDIYTGKIDNSVGRTVEFPLEMVDNDRRRECSFGLHVGALPYVSSYGSSSSSVWLLTKIDPADAVAVPLDHSAMKIRVKKYKVLEIIKRDLKEQKEGTLYSSDGKSLMDVREESWQWNSEELNRSETEQRKINLVRAHTKESAIEEVLKLGLLNSRQEAVNLSKDKLCEIIAESDMV